MDDREARRRVASAAFADGRFEQCAAALEAILETGADAAASAALGITLRRLGRIAAAEAQLRRAAATIADPPAHSRIEVQLAVLLVGEGRDAEAGEAAAHAAAHDPANEEAAILAAALGRGHADPGARADAAAALESLASELRSVGRLGLLRPLVEALARRQPDDGRALRLAARIALHSGDPAGARAALEAALRIDPDDLEAHMMLGSRRLADGDWQAGTAHRARRWRSMSFLQRIADYEMPLWTGQPPDGRRLLVQCQGEGLGDILFGLRLLPALAERAAWVALECPLALVGLVEANAARLGLAEVRPAGSPRPAADWHAPILDLLRAAPPAAPYLAADEGRRAAWAARLAALRPGPRRIGLVWAGQRRAGDDWTRSLRQPDLERLTGMLGGELVSLQVDAPCPPGIPDLGPEIRDFREMAACIAALDLVITVDTAAAHLAGALGRPVWTLLVDPPGDWRWAGQGERSRFYPSMRLFRQRRPADWSGVVDEVIASLARSAPQ